MTALDGETAVWGLTEQLLAAIADGVRVGNWQRGGDKKVKRPKPIPRPGVVDPSARKFKANKTYSVDELRDRLKNWGR